MKLPKISVIVPVYNAEKYFHRCIDSILSQTFTDFELLLINDGSTDRSGKICDEYANKDARIRVFHKENGGVSSARNIGLDNARGEWIAFCDSDDWVLNCWLENFVANFNGADIICQGIRYDKSFFESISVDSAFEYEGDAQGLLDIFYKWDVGYIFVKCFKTKIIKQNKICFDERFNYHEDEEFVLKYLTFCNRTYSTANIGYNYLVPNPKQNKYIIKNSLSLYNSLFNSANFIYGGKNNIVISHYLDGYTMKLLDCFKKTISIGRLREYRKSVGKLVLSSNLFCLTKWAILLDPTCIISSLILFVHSKLR